LIKINLKSSAVDLIGAAMPPPGAAIGAVPLVAIDKRGAGRALA
jgi:hypothetical protein